MQNGIIMLHKGAMKINLSEMISLYHIAQQMVMIISSSIKSINPLFLCFTARPYHATGMFGAPVLPLCSSHIVKSMLLPPGHVELCICYSLFLKQFSPTSSALIL